MAHGVDTAKTLQSTDLDATNDFNFDDFGSEY